MRRHFHGLSIPSLLLVLLLSIATPVLAIASATELPTASDAARSIFDSVDGVTFGGALLAVLAMLGGATMCLAGFKLFRLTLFAVGFVAGGTLFTVIVEHVFSSRSWLITASWIAFVGGGSVSGLLATTIYSAGIFVAGAAGGVLLAVVINTSIGFRVCPSNPEVALLVLAIVLGILGGVLPMRLEKPVLVVATSFVGAGLLVWGVGYFAGGYPSATDLKRYCTGTDTESGDWVYSLPSAWWVYLCGTLLIACSGVLVQSKLTGQGIARAGGEGDGSDTPVSAAAAPRKRVVMFARRDVVEVDLGTPKTSDSRSGYAVV